MIVFSQKHKTAKPGSETEPAEILEFKDTAKLCPVKHLKIRLKQTQVSEDRQAAVHQLFQTACARGETNFTRWKRWCWRVNELAQCGECGRGQQCPGQNRGVPLQTRGWQLGQRSSVCKVLQERLARFCWMGFFTIKCETVGLLIS